MLWGFSAKEWIEVISVLTIPFSAYFLIKYRKESDRGLGKRVIQFISIIIVFSLILVLGLEKILSTESIATLMGGLVGYLFAEFSKKNTETKD